MKPITLLLALSSAALAQIESVVPAAGLPPGDPAVAQESIISIYGHNLAPTTAVATTYPWPTTLGGVTVLMNNGFTDQAKAQLIFISPTQVNAFISQNSLDDNAPGVNTLTVLYSNRPPLQGYTISFFVDAVVPALFALAGNNAAALHPNYQVVSRSNPAVRGEYIALYATGLGVGRGGREHLRPRLGTMLLQRIHRWDPGHDNLSRPRARLLKRRLNQVNVQVPAGVRRGTFVPVVLATDCPWGGRGCQGATRNRTSNTVLLAIN
jgi:uncharacterized protein (TIGR03437 family)